jgi:hypothetical protein
LTIVTEEDLTTKTRIKVNISFTIKEENRLIVSLAHLANLGYYQNCRLSNYYVSLLYSYWASLLYLVSSNYRLEVLDYDNSSGNLLPRH